MTNKSSRLAGWHAARASAAPSALRISEDRAIIPGLQAYDHYFYAAAVLVGTGLAALAVLAALGGRRTGGALRRFAGVAPPFINVVGVLFGLTLAFLANDTWSAYDRAMAAVNAEADGLRSLVVIARHAPEPQARAVTGAVSDYARAAVDEWPLLAHRQASARADAAADALLSTLSSQAVVQASPGPLAEAQIRLALSIRDARQMRLALSQTHVNPIKWMGMAFLGFITLISVAVVHVDAPRAAAASVVLFSLASAPTAVLVLIHGNPFQPPAAVSPAPILQAFGPAAPP